MRSPIIKQVFIFGVISGIISLLLAVIGFGVVEFYKIRDASTVKLKSQMDIMAFNLQSPLVFDDKDAAEKIFMSLRDDRSITRAVLLRGDGAPFALYRTSTKKNNVKMSKDIYYQNRRIGQLIMESVYVGITEKYIAYFFMSLIIILITIPASYFISAPIRRQVSQGVTQLERQTNRLRQLADQVASTEQKERKRIAALIHDHLQQILAASKIQMDLALRRLRAKEYAQAEIKLSHSVNLLNEASLAARSLTVELRPPVLYEAGLAEAFIWLSNKFKNDHNFEVSLDTEEIPIQLSDNLKILIFESVKELLFNVVKYAGVHSAQVLLKYRSGFLIIGVKDTGAGFDPKLIEKTSSTTGGFGLFSIRERIKLLEGSFQILSKPQQGTQIEITIPVDKMMDAGIENIPIEIEEEHSVATKSKHKKINILLVDDHKIVREGLANLLKENDVFNVIAQAENGEEAVEKTGTYAPDVVIMDINMPKLNGIEATRIIKSRYPNVDVIGLSVQDERDVAESMKKAGAVTLVNKGGDPQELVNSILECKKMS